MEKKMKSFIASLLSLLAFNAGVYASEAKSDVTSDESLSRLKAGNVRFISGSSIHPNLTPARRHETATSGQHPFATIIACSDSRGPVEAIFDAGVGDLFVVRVAGNVSDVDEIGTAEYGVEHLHTPLLIVMGHSACGAVTAVCKNAHVPGSIPKLVDNIGPAVKRIVKTSGDSVSPSLIDAAIRENVWQSIADLMEHSEIISKKVRGGELQILGAYYDLKSGEVQWMGAHPAQSKIVGAFGKEGHSALSEVLSPKGVFFYPILLAALLMMVFFLFIWERRLFKALRFQGRFSLALTAFVIAGALFSYSVFGRETPGIHAHGQSAWVTASILSGLSLVLLGWIYAATLRSQIIKYFTELQATRGPGQS